jgi:hypothetical protein
MLGLICGLVAANLQEGLWWLLHESMDAACSSTLLPQVACEAQIDPR